MYLVKVFLIANNKPIKKNCVQKKHDKVSQYLRTLYFFSKRIKKQQKQITINTTDFSSLIFLLDLHYLKYVL